MRAGTTPRPMRETCSRATRPSTSRHSRSGRTTRTNTSAPATPRSNRANPEEEKLMLKARARLAGALILGAALALPLGASAQAPASPPVPTTAPTKDAGNVPVAPQVAPPKPAAGSTAVPGWNNPPAWDSASERPQYASVPGIDTNRLIQGAGREWREFRNGPLTRLGGWMLVGVLAIILVLYL